MDERIETREMPAHELEVREAAGNAPVISGYAVRFNVWSRTLYDYRGKPFVERFAPGAFDAWLRTDPELVALWNHNADLPLARRSRGTLRIAIDDVGVRFELDPPPNTWGQDALTAIRRGDVGGMSFLFEASNDSWGKPGADGVAQRTVLESVLHEISPVTFPAYPATTVAVRSVSVPDFSESDDQVIDERERQQALRAVRLRKLELYRRL